MAATAPDESGLARARRAVGRSAWDDACETYAGLGTDVALEPADLERWATASYLIGHVDDAVAHLGEAYEIHCAENRPESAARDGFWIVFTLLHRGEVARASGWWSRCRSLLRDVASDSAATGYLLCLDGFRLAAIEHRFAEAERTGEQAVEIGRRRAEGDVLALGLNICGRAAVRAGRPAEGLVRLDEAMVELLSGSVSPIVTGTVYCSVIEACEELGEVERAREWTAALDRWCAGQEQMVTFSGRCLIHRAAIALREGDWDGARTLATAACERLRGAADEASTGRASYVLGELARLTGDDELAEREYRSASDWGHDPQPGLALLRLRQGRTADALGAIRRLLADTSMELARAGVLPAAVQVLLEGGEVADAAIASDELAALADRFDTAALRAHAERAAGAVASARGDDGGIEILRRACERFRSLPAPYETARTRVLIAERSEQLGDRETAEIEREGARRTYERLGATPDLEQLARPPGGEAHGLSPRELEVLGLVATGVTNQQIADELCIALRTVDRHVENILRKLDVSSRTAATAAAYELQLL